MSNGAWLKPDHHVYGEEPARGDDSFGASIVFGVLALGFLAIGLHRLDVANHTILMPLFFVLHGLLWLINLAAHTLFAMPWDYRWPSADDTEIFLVAMALASPIVWVAVRLIRTLRLVSRLAAIARLIVTSPIAGLLWIGQRRRQIAGSLGAARSVAAQRFKKACK